MKWKSLIEILISDESRIVLAHMFREPGVKILELLWP